MHHRGPSPPGGNSPPYPYPIQNSYRLVTGGWKEIRLKLSPAFENFKRLEASHARLKSTLWSHRELAFGPASVDSDVFGFERFDEVRPTGALMTVGQIFEVRGMSKTCLPLCRNVIPKFTVIRLPASGGP